jgi:hypothetical protein
MLLGKSSALTPSHTPSQTSQTRLLPTAVAMPSSICGEQDASRTPRKTYAKPFGTSREPLNGWRPRLEAERPYQTGWTPEPGEQEAQGE